MNETLSHRGRLWRWQGGTGSGTWFFVIIDGEAGASLSATALMRRLEGQARGFGSMRVMATIGDTQWRTSVFPQKEEGWLLPVKAAVRRAELLDEDEELAVTLQF